jgi:hypothetical protein
MLELAYLMSDCWLEVSLHPEGPATCQLDQGFPWFFLVPQLENIFYSRIDGKVCFLAKGLYITI